MSWFIVCIASTHMLLQSVSQFWERNCIIFIALVGCTELLCPADKLSSSFWWDFVWRERKKRFFVLKFWLLGESCTLVHSLVAHRQRLDDDEVALPSISPFSCHSASVRKDGREREREFSRNSVCEWVSVVYVQVCRGCVCVCAFMCVKRDCLECESFVGAEVWRLKTSSLSLVLSLSHIQTHSLSISLSLAHYFILQNAHPDWDSVVKQTERKTKRKETPDRPNGRNFLVVLKLTKQKLRGKTIDKNERTSKSLNVNCYFVFFVRMWSGDFYVQCWRKIIVLWILFDEN